MKGRRKYMSRRPFHRMKKSEADEYLNKEVFSIDDFDIHVKRVAFNLKVEEVIVREVLQSYFRNVMYLLNKVAIVKTKINITGFFSFVLEKGSRV